MSSLLCALLALLAVAQAAPPHPANIQHRWEKRQTADLVLTETRVQVFSETLTETLTKTFTTTEGSGSETTSTTLTDSASATTGSANALPVPEVHFVGDVPNPDPQAQSILFLPLDTPAFSDSDSAAVSSSTESALPSSAVSASASASASAAPSGTVPQSDSDPADASAYSGAGSPAFAAQTPVVKGPLISAYYPDWVASDLPPEKIDMTRMDWIDFAFVTPDQNFQLTWDDPDGSPGILTRLVSAAHNKGTKVKLSIGGWGGSKYFSPACATTTTRATFVNNIVKLYNQYKLDGIDIDWEYPGQQGAGSNVVSPQDSANFLAMLKLLRSSLPKTARITAAVQDAPFADANGNPMTDVSAFAAVLDWVNIMNYDVFGSSTKPGPNAPLANACHDSSQPTSNAAAAISAWAAAKFPASRLMLGVPFYGYVNPSHATQLQHKKRSLLFAEPLVRRQSVDGTQNGTAPVVSAVSALPSVPVVPAVSAVSNMTAVAPLPTLSVPGTLDEAQADAASAATTTSTPGTVTVKSSDDTTDSGQLQFISLISQGALLLARVGTTGESVTFLATGGFTRFWDSCSSTPFLSSPYTNQVVTYDDPQSLGLKAAYAKQAQILGTAVWDLSGDTAQWDLMNALRRGLGKPV